MVKTNMQTLENKWSRGYIVEGLIKQETAKMVFMDSFKHMSVKRFIFLYKTNGTLYLILEYVDLGQISLCFYRI